MKSINGILTQEVGSLNLLNRPLQERRYLATSTVPTIFFFNLNTVLLVDELLQKNILAPLENESKQNNLI
jgi:hypothetical protein